MKTQYAGFWKRFVAFLVDQAILSAVIIPLALAFGISSITKVFEAQTVADLEAASGGNSIQSVMYFAAAFFYYFLFLTFKNGQTPGRMLLAIRVTKSNGKPVGPVDVVVRFISSLLSAFVFFLGFLWVAWDDKKQGWHDKIASTVVVKTGKKSNLALGIIIAVVIYSSIYGAVFTKGFMLGFNEAKNPSSNTAKNLDLTDGESAVIGIVMDNYTQMRDLQSTNLNDPSEDIASQIIALNDKNIEILEQAVNDYPDSAPLWNMLGNSYTWKSTKNYTPQDTLKAYKTSFDLDNSNGVVAGNVGYVYLYQLGDANNAIIYYERSVRLKPENNPDSYLGLARAYSSLKLKEKQIENSKKAIEQYSQRNEDGSYDAIILDLRKLESGEYNYRLN